MKNIAAALFIATTFCAAAQETKIKTTDLPNESLAFIQQYFIKPVVKSAVKNIDDQKISYEAILEDKTEIEFREDGSWKEVDGKGKVIPVAIIPHIFLDYVTKNYPQAEFTKIDKEVSGNIDISLSTGEKLVFNKHGKFVKLN